MCVHVTCKKSKLFVHQLLKNQTGTDYIVETLAYQGGFSLSEVIFIKKLYLMHLKIRKLKGFFLYYG